MSSRASRSEFWWFVLVNYVVGALALLLDVAIWRRPGVVGPFEAATWLVFFLPQFAVTVRRLHDTGREAWHVFAPLPLCAGGIALGAVLGPSLGQPGATLAGAVTLLALLTPVIWLLQRSQPGPNRHGPDPLARDA